MKNSYLKILLFCSVSASNLVSAANLDLEKSPLDASSGSAVPPNVMLLLDNSASMVAPPHVNSSEPLKIKTATDVLKNIVTSNANIRFGLATFNRVGSRVDRRGQGGKINLPCDAGSGNIQKIVSELNVYAQATKPRDLRFNTPLAEAYYEITRYFRGLPSYYGRFYYDNPRWYYQRYFENPAVFKNGKYISPVQYRCQKNFIVVITDGQPTADNDFDINDPDNTSTQKIPNWDNKNYCMTNDLSSHKESQADITECGYADTAGYPDSSFFDMSKKYLPPNGIPNSRTPGFGLYLDDIAKFAWDTDIKKSGVDIAGGSYQQAPYDKQNIITYTISFDTGRLNLRGAAEGEGPTGHQYGHGKYYNADDADQLSAALDNIITDLIHKSGSSSAAAVNSARIKTGTTIYQSKYNTTDWSGKVLAYAVETDPTNPEYGNIKTNGTGPGGSLYNMGDKIPAWDNRVIITDLPKSGSNQGVAFRWDSFTGQQQQSFFNDKEILLEYLRGRSDAQVKEYRDRTTLLGDIVNSSAYHVSPPAARYGDNLEARPYSSFITANKSRESVLYVGANDGMLHGFQTTGTNAGKEILAYVPSTILPEIKNLAGKDYSHQYYVDGSPTVVDAYNDNANKWQTVLTAGLRGGGQAVYALNVTDPSSFTEANADKIFMWEFTDADDADMGYSYSRPKIVKMQDGKWYAVFGNGYNNTVNDSHQSTTGAAVIYIVDLWTGALVKKISTNVGSANDPTGKSRPNGFATLTPIDVDGDMKVDYIYGGDLFGNIWKFNAKDADPSKWVLAYKLFSATNSTGLAQAVTSAVTVGRSKTGRGYMVYFGTGKYLGPSDKNSKEAQSFYAIWDNGTGVSGRGALLKQEVIADVEVSVVNQNGTPNDTTDDTTEKVTLRKTSNNLPTLANKGWYIDLPSTSGERVIASPVLRGNQVVFVTKAISSSGSSTADLCVVTSSDSWLMTLNAFTGGRLNQTFDVNNDNSFDASDKVLTDGSAPIATSGIKSASGSSSPGFISDGTSDRVVISGDSGLQVLKLYSADTSGRKSWQQIMR